MTDAQSILSHRRSQTDLEAVQLTALRGLVAQLRGRNAFWTPRLAALSDGGPATLGDWTASVPLTSKHDLVADHRAHAPYGSNLTEPLESYRRLHQTSATTGPPLRWLDTEASWSWLLDNWAAVLVGAGVTPADRIFFAFSFGPFLGFWAGFEAAHRMGCLTLPGGALDTAGRAAAVYDHGVTVLCATPTYATRLGESMRDVGLDPAQSPVRALIVAGEPGGCVPAARRHLEELWPGATVFDHYGMTEVGPVTYQCPPEMDVVYPLESAYRCELIDPNGGAPLPVESDVPQEGELVLTTLGRAASPLLRYRTGDLVRARRERAADGRCLGLAFEGGILGRVDDMLVVRGVNLFPSAVDEVVRSVPGVAEYRVEIREEHGMVEVELLVERNPHSESNNGLVEALERALRERFPLRIPVHAVRPGVLPRFELKARRWVRLKSATDAIPADARE